MIDEEGNVLEDPRCVCVCCEALVRRDGLLCRPPLPCSMPTVLPSPLPSSSYTQRPWLRSLQDVVPELKGGKTTPQNGNAFPKWPETTEDVRIPGVRRRGGGREGACVRVTGCT